MRTLLASSTLLVALIIASPPALAQNAPVCLKTSSGMMNCAYQSVAQCEVAKGMNLAAQCIPSPQLSTTGQGGGPPPRNGPPTPPPTPSTR